MVKTNKDGERIHWSKTLLLFVFVFVFPRTCCVNSGGTAHLFAPVPDVTTLEDTSFIMIVICIPVRGSVSSRVTNRVIVFPLSPSHFMCLLIYTPGTRRWWVSLWSRQASYITISSAHILYISQYVLSYRTRKMPIIVKNEEPRLVRERERVLIYFITLITVRRNGFPFRKALEFRYFVVL